MDNIFLLQNINLGNSVAEFDQNLKNYFITTPAVMEIISNRGDIIRGTKGSGKSAILLTLIEKKDSFSQLSRTILVPATNHLGDPVFKTAFTQISVPLGSEQQLIDSWKVYLINIIWPQIKKICVEKTEVEDYLKEKKLITTHLTWLEKLQFSLKRILSPKNIKTSVEDPNGYIYSAEATLSDQEIENLEMIDFNYIFMSLEEILKKYDTQLWVLMDRLDDAFPGNPELENVALKALLYAYKDIAGLQYLRIKIFIRDDIYDRITKTGFRSLTHVNTNAMLPIKWTEEKLLHMVCERLLFNPCFKEYLISRGYNPDDIKSNDDRELILLMLFRDQVDIGPKSPPTFRWILNHVRDGKGDITPRDVIALIDKARIDQAEEWSINPPAGSDENGSYLIGPGSLKKAWSLVSRDKMETQLYAEYPHLKPSILKFTGGKAEHNMSSLSSSLGEKWKEVLEELINIGFLEKLTGSWKIPFLYREALEITQGKAFDTSEDADVAG